MSNATLNSTKPAIAIDNAVLTVEPVAQPVDKALAETLAECLTLAKSGDSRYWIKQRMTPKVSGCLAVYLTAIKTPEKTREVVYVKPLNGGKAIVLGEMFPTGMEVCKTVSLSADISAAIDKANNTWAEELKADKKQSALEAKLTKVSEHFSNNANGVFIDL